MSSFMETPEKRLVTVSVDALPHLEGLHRQILNSRWFTYLDLTSIKTGPLVFNWRKLELPGRRQAQLYYDSEDMDVPFHAGDGISVSFSRK